MSGCLDVWMSGCLDVRMSGCPDGRYEIPLGLVNARHATPLGIIFLYTEHVERLRREVPAFVIANPQLVLQGRQPA